MNLVIDVKVRLIDIAKLANVSVATVSIVLNDPDTTRISKEKKAEVLKIANDLNYFPNTAAQSLVTNKSNTIGLVIPDIENPFFSTLAKIIEQRCRKEKLAIIIMNTLEDYHNDPDIIRSLRRRGVDGMIVALSSETYFDDKKIKNILNNLDVPFVLVDRTLRDFEANKVYFNNLHGGYIATKYLIDNGHTKIGYISAQNHAMTGYFRHKGYIQALEEAGIPVNDDYIVHGVYDVKTGYDLAEQLYNQGVSAIACGNDLNAFGVQKKLVEMGLSVPEDISLVGYDNLEFNDFLQKGLTSVDQDITELAHQGVNILLEALHHQDKKVEVMLEPTLTIRNSVKKI